jgi:hypothetical protein
MPEVDKEGQEFSLEKRTNTEGFFLGFLILRPAAQ